MTINNPSDTGRELRDKIELKVTNSVEGFFFRNKTRLRGSGLHKSMDQIVVDITNAMLKIIKSEVNIQSRAAIRKALASKGEEVIKLKRENDLLVGYRDLLIELHPDKESTLTPTDKGKEGK